MKIDAKKDSKEREIFALAKKKRCLSVSFETRPQHAQ